MLDPRRNISQQQQSLQVALQRASQCTSICWLPGDEYEPISRGHADAILAFADPNTVLFNWTDDEHSVERQVCERNLQAFTSWARRENRNYDIIKLPCSVVRDPYYCGSYVNFAHVNGAVIVPRHGRRSAKLDDRARSIIQDVFGKPAISVPIEGIAAHGGGIHCCTQQQPMGGSLTRQ